MSKVTRPELGWAVLTHPTGEVLTAEARSPGLHLGLLGVPPGFAPRDAEGWLYDVMGVAHESSANQPAPRPIPTILYHAMTGLLFSHGELWDQPHLSSPCSFAFVETRGEIGFGWVGLAKVSVWVDGQQREPGWVTLRDDRGRESRAWSIPSHHDVQVRISWSPLAGVPTAGGAEVEATWSAEGGTDLPVARPHHPAGFEVAHRTALPLDEVTAAMPRFAEDSPSDRVLEGNPAEEELPAGSESAPGDESIPVPDGSEPVHDWIAEYEVEARRSSGGFGGWLRNAFAWLMGRAPKAGASTAPDAGDMMTSDSIPRGDGPPEGAPATDSSFADDTPAAEGDYSKETSFVFPDVIPPTPEPETSASEGEASPPSVAFLRPERVIQIPPSPEPAELTTRAIQWGEADDPNRIELPALEPAAPASAATAPPLPPPVEAELRIVDVTLDEPPALAGFPLALPRLEGLQPLAEETAPPLRVSAGAPAEALTSSPGTEPKLERAPMAGPMGITVVRGMPAAAVPAVPAATPDPQQVFPPQRPAWPSAQELARPRGLPGRRLGLWIVLVGALFAGGWLVGSMQDDGRTRDAGRRGALGDALHAVGLGGPRFVVQVNSRPPGAWISVDGENLTLRTPCALEVPPGEHTIGLSFSEFGSATFPVRGRKGDRVPIDATMWGVLEVFSPDEFGVISVSVDGVTRGFAPLRVDSLTPGVHEVRFSGPDVAAWGQTVDIRVGEAREVLARAVQSPLSGVLQVEASLTDETGTQPLKGAQVWIDGELRGITPLTADLPRGPHSVRLVHKGQEAPIQVIDLPGGNQRFAVFEIGLDQDVPRLVVDVAARIPRDRPAVLSATVVGIAASEVREMWLHVRMPEGAWRRYPMTVLKAPAGAAGVATFPTVAFDDQGHARYYVSAASGQGDETFTEIRAIAIEAPPATGR